MDWRRLQIFKNISTFTSFTHASKELKKSQSTLSRDIISLEKMIGYKLFWISKICIDKFKRI